MINNIELYYNKYTEEELINNIDNLSVYTILTTQHNLSKKFIDDYILNPEYQFCQKEKDITIVNIQLHQPQYFNYIKD